MLNEFTRNFEYKIDHISKTKNLKNLKFGSAFVCASFGTKKVVDIFGRLLRSKGPVNFEYKIYHNSKNKIAKIGKFIFHSFHYIADLSCKYGHF